MLNRILIQFFQILDNGSLLNFNDPTFNNDVNFDFSDAYIALNYRLRTGIFTIDPGLDPTLLQNKKYSIRDII